MNNEINDLKKIVAEFKARIIFETQQFELKFNEKLQIIMTHDSKNKYTNIPAQTQVPQLPETGYLRLKHIIGDRKASPPTVGIFPVAPSTWYKGVKLGYFPKPIKLGSRTSAWKVEDIRKLIARMPEKISS